jgi:DNA mismatch repair protein MutS
MCGIPVKAVDVYIAKAIEAGYKIAICEQLTEPKAGSLVERDVVRVITPGTIMESEILDDKKNNYLASIYVSKNTIGISWCDITTGEFNTTELSNCTIDKINDILTMISPAEIICNSNALEFETSLNSLDRKELPKFTKYFDTSFEESKATDILEKQFKTVSLKAFDLDGKSGAISSSGALLAYLLDTQKRSLSHINGIKYVSYSNYMHLDYITRKNLELTKNARDGGKFGTIFWYLDKTSTSMGARMLRKFVEEPLQKIEEIKLRQDGVEELYKNIIKREAISNALSKVNDLERLCGRISYNSLTPKDCIFLKNSLLGLPAIKELVRDTKSKVLQSIYNGIDDHNDVYMLLDSAIIEKETPSNTKDGGFIKDGYSAELDELRRASKQGKDWILDLAKKEQEETGIKNLKISYNRIFGYYIEVLNTQKDLVPFRYQRKQTLANCERYVTNELLELEQKILGADEKALKLEQRLFVELREKLLEQIAKIKNTAQYISYLDVLCSLASVAVKNNLVRPKMVSSDEEMSILDGRHPIVEAISKESFVPNDTLLDKYDNRTMIITGPNMAGKSTYMRQVAVITIMAHIGSFVPAKSAKIPITDRVFTRIGATDDLAYGQSTFMVEMTEVANILRNATPNSLILLDEIGRGTSTFDGLSIAWSVMEYISQNLVSKTLFSTHYHELTELEGNLKGVKNYRISVKEYNGSIIFLRKIVRGGANKSFGIEVASLAGLPQSVITRSKEILHTLEETDVNKNMAYQNQSDENFSFKRNENEVLNILKETKIETITPFEAMSLINDLKEKLENK